MDSESRSKQMTSYKVNQNIKIGLILGILQFTVYFSGYDHLIRLGSFRAHHFLELPAFYYIGYGFSEFFHDQRGSNRNSMITCLVIYVFNILVYPRGLSASTIIAALIVSSPYLIGVIHHLNKAKQT